MFDIRQGGDPIFSPNNLKGMTKKVYDHLYELIVSDQLPPESTLSELEIARELQVSRSPVREAMIALENEGMIRRYPGRGCVVAEVTVQDLDEIFHLRTLLEVDALEKSYDIVDMRVLALVEQDLLALKSDDPADAYYEADRQLHALITNTCGNMRLIYILRTLAGQIERLRRISAAQSERLQSSKKEHLELVDALKRQDLERAREVLTRHIDNIHVSTLNVYRRLGLNDSRLYNQ